MSALSGDGRARAVRLPWPTCVRLAGRRPCTYVSVSCALCIQSDLQVPLWPEPKSSPSPQSLRIRVQRVQQLMAKAGGGAGASPTLGGGPRGTQTSKAEAVGSAAVMA